MAETRHCPQCGKALFPDAPAGLCPACLLEQGRDRGQGEGPTRTSPASGSFVAPQPEALEGKFPTLEILELLGTGGMGAVYKARQSHLNRLVAVKILPSELGNDPAFEERFTREAQALAKLNHPNIVGVHDFGQTDGLYYLVMEYVDGANIRQLIQAGGLKPEEALAIVPQICEALQFAHDEGIVHRDIKPENILVDKKGRVKIADFGLAKLLHPSPEPAAHARAMSAKGGGGITLTGTGQVMGTLHYMAPEQLKGSHGVDHRADIYSLGVVFYEMLTGELPIGRFAPPSKKVQVDVRLDEVVLRSLENEPERRYQTASEVKTDVERISIRLPLAPATPNGGADASFPQRLSHLKRVVGFWATPQPGFGQWVGLPMLILLGLWVTALAIELAPGTTLLPVKEPEGAWVATGLAIFPVGFLFLTLLWAMVGRGNNVQVRTPPESRAAHDSAVRGPAIGLMITGVLNWIGTPLICYLVFWRPVSERIATGSLTMSASTRMSILVSVGLGTLLVGGLLFLAAFLMMRLRGYWLAIFGSTLAMIIAPGNLIGLPIGMWALVVLSQREVRQAFRGSRRREQDDDPSQDGPAGGK